jgi:hypothetical protein
VVSGTVVVGSGVVVVGSGVVVVVGTGVVDVVSSGVVVVALVKLVKFSSMNGAVVAMYWVVLGNRAHTFSAI